MDKAMELAQAQLLAAQKQVRALSMVPDQDTFPEGTVIRWRQVGRHWDAAIKLGSGQWWVTGRNSSTDSSWDALRRMYFTRELTAFEVAASWGDGRVGPPVEVEGNGTLRLIDTATGVSWERVGDEWQRRVDCRNCQEPIEKDIAGDWVHVRDGLSFCEGFDGEQAEPEE